MVRYHIEKVFEFLPKLIPALPLTLGVLIVVVFLGSAFGALLAWGQLSQDKAAQVASRSFIFIMRCTPPIVLIFLVFYGLPRLLEFWLGIDINEWPQAVFTIIAMTMLYAATVSEVFKSAYQAIAKGQLEAALSIGLTPVQGLLRIVFPQALRVALPNLSNAILNLLKDIALAYTIGLVDIMGASYLLIGRNMGNYTLETYTAAAVLYWVLSIILTVVIQWSEKALSPEVS